MDFKEVLLDWYKKNGRELPWRGISTPYFIWVSEVILQQTRVNQGMEYYFRFISKFPDIESLANAPIDELMKVWQGLGYYSRARNLQAGARQVVSDYGGKLPETYEELLKIKSLGHYAAAAVASFAFNKVVPAVDGNVFRILSRVFGIFTPIGSTSARKEFFSLAQELISKENPAAFNQAIIDFGALVCTPRNARCETCPMSGFCYAFSNNIVYKLPVKQKKVPPKDRFLCYFMIRKGNYTFVRRREENDIWHSLYEFPVLETKGQLSHEEILVHPFFTELFGNVDVKIHSISDPIKHQLSHLTIWAQFVIVSVDSVPYLVKSKYRQVKIDELEKFSVPRLIDSYMAAEQTAKYFLKK
ncbi:MAG: A/G-specific adenine glycosylase [Bacteroidales bacterium]|nr:A/G-specific adenine glycosylase [Bacteroidales bacterium]